MSAPETPRTWTLEGGLVRPMDQLGRLRPSEPLTIVVGGFVDISERIEVVEKAPVDAERERMLDVIEKLVWGGSSPKYDEAKALLREHDRLPKDTPSLSDALMRASHVDAGDGEK